MCFFIPYCYFSIYKLTLALLSSRNTNHFIVFSQEFQELFLHVVELDDVEALVEADDPEVVFGEMDDIAFAFGDFSDPMLKLFV